MKPELPPSKEVEAPVDDGKTRYVLAQGYDVCSWRPGPPGSGPATQVHVVIPVFSDMKIVFRLKSARALDELVGVLLEYRKEVWGAPE